MNGVVTVVKDSIPIAAKHLSELNDLRMTQGSGQRTPLVNAFIGPRTGLIGPNVFKLVLLTFGAKDLAVMALDPDPGRGEVEVPKRSLLLAVDSHPFASTDMADGMESFVGHYFDPSSFGIFQDPLFHNPDSWKGEIVCYTEIGHRWPPLDNFLARIQVYYPLEIPDVHFSFVAWT